MTIAQIESVACSVVVITQKRGIRPGIRRTFASPHSAMEAGARKRAGRKRSTSPNSARTIRKNQPTDVIAMMPMTNISSIGIIWTWSFQSLIANRAEQPKKAKPVQRAAGRGARSIAPAIAMRIPAVIPRRSWDMSPVISLPVILFLPGLESA